MTEETIDLTQVGWILIQLVRAASTMGHKWLRFSVRDYVRDLPDEASEARLVRDILVLPVPELVARWPFLGEPVEL